VTRPARRVLAVVPASAAGARLDRFLATVPALGTRSQVKRLADAGRVRVDGVPRKAAFAVREGARVEVDVPPVEPISTAAEPIDLDVLYEDADLIAIAKPPGLVTHPAPGARRGTVVNAIAHRLGVLAGVGHPDRPGIVHRLDRDTSGVLLVARTVEALEGLARQFRDRSIEKEYVALVHGHPRRDTGTIDRPVGRHRSERTRMSVRSRRGRAAVSHFTVVERLPGATLLRVRPETGRTHQIRVHLASIGHPIAGDRLYGRRSAPANAAERVLAACPRQALHARVLRFRHPRTGRAMAVEAALPADIAAMLQALRGLRRP
jgi:23S rRNA pseudouridine1911/1915/1917 synthase